MKLEQRKVAFVGALVVGLGCAPMAYAYGGGGKPPESFACQAPTFTVLSPERESEVASFSEFSFMTSKDVNVPTLVVKVNGQPVQVSTEDKALGLQVKATLAQPIAEPGMVLVSAAIDNAGGGCPGRLAYRVKVSGAAVSKTQDAPAKSE
ncbi:MAG: hypothetical protein ACREYE_09385 [Gammaproteobacteria bacterium]